MSIVPPQLGQPAPEFDLPAFVPGQGEERFSSVSLLGQPYLLYFYPRAMTPGCTTQACALRDGASEALLLPDGQKLLVLGVSPDPVARLKRFAEKEQLNFPLLSDEEHVLANAWGVWQEKKLYGRVSMGIVRSSFLVDSHGFLRAENRKVRAAKHLEWVQGVLPELNTAMPSHASKPVPQA